MKKMYCKFSLIIALVTFILMTTLVHARGAGGRAEGGFRDGDRSFHLENEHPREAYRPENIKNWQHGNGHGYTHNGMHYNYYHNGNYFNYYHNGAYYNYYYRGNYYNYYNNGLYYLFFYNGLYYNNCNNVPRGYPNCP